MEEHQTASVSLSSPYSTNNLPELKTASGATCTVTTDNLETIFEFMSQLETACGIDRNNEMSTPDEDANSLSRLAADSDIIPEVDLVVVRKYPLLFYMKKGDGHLVEYLSEREFEIQTDQQRLLAETEYQKLLPEVEARVRDQVIPKPPSRPYSNLLDDTDDEELLSHFLNSDDNDLWVCLSAEKRASLEKTKLRLDDQIRVNISAEMERLLQLKPWKLDAKPVLRLRVVTPQAFRSGRSCDPGAVLSFWNQPQVVAESIEEGEVYRFLQIKNSGIKNPQDLKLVFTGESRFEHLESIPQLSPFTRRLSTIAEILTFKVQAPFQEIDTAGKVIKVCDDDCAILRDQHGNEMKIQFHKPLKVKNLPKKKLIHSLKIPCSMHN